MLRLQFLTFFLLSFGILTASEFTFTHYSPGSEYAAITLADYNGDGIDEVWAANWNTNQVEIWSYNQLNDSLEMVDVVTGFPYNIWDITVADMDDDGDPDLMAALRNYGTYYCENTGSGWNINNINGTYGWQVLTADFNMDDHLDILSCTDWGYLMIFYGDGEGNFVQGIAPLSAVTNGDSKGMNIVDINGDNRPDIMGMAAEWEGSGTNDYFLRVYLNTAEEDTFSWSSSIGPVDPLSHLPVAVISSFPSQGDFNDDGIPDQVAYSSNGELIFFTGGKIGDSLYWTAETLATFSGTIVESPVFDWNGDSNLDIIVGGGANFQNLYLFLGDGMGHFTTDTLVLDYGVGRQHSIKMGDLDGNNVADVIFTKTNGSYDGFILGISPGVNPDPAINAVYDVPNDQGGWVYLDISPSALDKTGGIESYNVLSMNPENEWVITGSFAAMNESTPYIYLAPTFADSTITSGLFLSSFKVVARASGGGALYESNVMTGYSLDNIAPHIPENLVFSTTENSVSLSWSAPVDKDFQFFEIWRNQSLYATTIDPELYDDLPEANNTYAIYAVDYAGNKSEPLISQLIIVGISEESKPLTFALEQNFPNPFNPATRIKYQLPQAANVHLVVFNILGQKVRTLIDGFEDAGFKTVTWDGKNMNGRLMPSGIYYYQLKTENFNKIMKMVLLK